MENLKNGFLLLIIAISTYLSPSYGQEKKDSVRYFKNTIRINLSNPLLFGDKNLIVGYERAFKNNQSITVNIGRISFPKIVNINENSIQLQQSSKDIGYGLALDYRFYLKKENKYKAPRGIYIGPYYTYDYFKRENTWTLNTADFTGEVKTDITFKANLVGFQMGYQFVFWNRLALDLVLFGPGKWFYNFNTELNTSLSADDEDLLFSKINGFIDDKIPGNSLVIKPGSLHKKGSSSSSSGGFRYVVHLGFRF